MAKNLRAKIPEGDRLVIYDRNEEATTQFVHEVAAPSADLGTNPRRDIDTEVAVTARRVVERSVSLALYTPDTICALYDEYVLSMT